jgi:hypothetical protein
MSAIAIKSLADLRRTLKPGMRVHCVENTYRPELNGKTRLVRRVQGNAFTWVHEGEDMKESWTRYEKASQFTFDGTDTFTMKLFDDDARIVRLRVLAEVANG